MLWMVEKLGAEIIFVFGSSPDKGQPDDEC